MTDSLEPRGPSNTGMILVGIAIGVVAGAGLALLLAPESGRRTRVRLGSAARHLGKRIGETIDQARETVTDLGTDARSALKTGQDAFLSDRSARDTRPARRATHPDAAGLDLNAAQRTGE